ncbi:hypothetical protein [Bradyrhizobium sp. Tv2a-2]|uniref:hypothetical protein n=1 Tax=Bradyrhizobium sp. Tv2a-2 TaxID=113395 RepID=UPI0012EB94C1|nr:hypothetical protein [Bradyrhizobium sp. Tv2a-2]
MSAALLPFCFAFSSSAFAGDYVVSYAIDAGSLNDTGTVRSCRYGELCRVSSKSLDLSILISVYLPLRRNQKELNVSVSGGRSRPDCCFLSDGVDWRSFTLEESFFEIRLYEGHARRRNEFLINSPLGILYLQFSDLK